MGKENKCDTGLMDEIRKTSSQENTITWKAIKIKIRQTISLYDMMELVTSASNLCFSHEGDYVPEVFDFAYKMNVLRKYTDLTLPDDISDIYMFVYGTDIFERVCEHVNQTQLKEIFDSIAKKVKDTCDTHQSDIHKKFDQAIESLNKLSGSLEGMFNGVNKEDIQRLTGAIAGGDISVEKLVKAYISAEDDNDENDDPRSDSKQDSGTAKGVAN